METSPKANIEPPKQEPPNESPNLKTGVLKLLGEISQYALFGIFALYAVGFLIWRSYLANYGMSSVAFLQAEYLSAAICYLLVLALFGVPSALIFERMFRWLERRFKLPSERRIDAEKRSSKSESLSMFLYLWILIIWLASGGIFPSTAKGSNLTLGIIMLAVTILCVVFGIINGILRWKFKDQTFYDKTKKIDVITLWFATLIVVGLFFNASISKSFLFLTIIIYPVAFVYLSASRSDPHFRTMTIIGLFLVLIMHAQLFGKSQFGNIPRSFGGGKPETAYLKFSQPSENLAKSLGLPVITDVALLGGFYGPVSILLRSENEIALVNFAESALRDIELVETNALARSAETNSIAAVGYVNHPPNPARVTAKQIRPELIDVIIYAK